MYKFKFADIGEGLHEGVVAEIYKKVGDEVKEGDPLFSVETDKVTSDIPSPVTGKITKVLMNQGDTIHVGQEIYYIDDGSTTESNDDTAPTETAAEEESAASVVGEVKVSNELLSFNFSTPAPVKAAPESAPSATVESSKVETQFDKGKSYTGAIEAEFDVIVIGSGPGGYLAAEMSGDHGLKTLIIEKEFWGGVCLNVGCIPTKALLKTAEVHEYIKHAADYGVDINTSSLKINWEKMHQRKRDVVAQLTTGVQLLMKANKVKTIFGEAKFIGAHEIEVVGKVYRGKNIIIATGSSDRHLDLPGFEDGYKTGKLITSKEAINLDKKPKTMTIVGGGVIGVEFSQVFAQTGVKVTILQNTDRILAGIDAELAKVIATKLESTGVEIVYNAQVTKFEKDTLFYTIDNKEHSIKADVSLVSVGRVPESLGLAEVGIKLGQRKEVPVDEYCRTNVEGVYGIGDVVGQSMLAHVAYRHAAIAVSHITNHPVKYSSKTLPSCIYTHPEIAIVGLTEEEAKAKGKTPLVVRYQFTYVGKAIATNNKIGFAKFVIDKEFGEILGCHIVGPHATDLISEIVVAMDLETTIYDIASAIHPHPTFSEVLWEGARLAVKMLEKTK
ncbi:dihydrolipoyl dehydrogenase [Mycoplasma iguanae]|uniref:Dihydrolipoyl dehydrogenase n=1 Tax=Mycoplasma iguanae TaxID=292461 RepID=A0ABY5R7S4_9MOLU|nr:dihydrolipoyl dehydrogenase [Mycoplasma iguanae]UVD81509.1 dihydrolipoyl dehydrogenase [Mycoplasma iguanae]